MRAILCFTMITIVLTACKKEPIVPVKPMYGGVIQIDTLGMYVADSIVGTTWIVTQWSSGLQTTARQDTLFFVNSFLYMYGAVREHYALTTSGSQFSLTLNGTPIGDLSALVPRNFLKYGELSNVLVKSVSNGSNGACYQIWMKRVH